MTKLIDKEFMKRATPEVVKKLLAEGADVNERDKKYGATPLLFAVLFNKNPKVIRVLIEAGADTSATCSDDIYHIPVGKEMEEIQEKYERTD